MKYMLMISKILIIMQKKIILKIQVKKLFLKIVTLSLSIFLITKKNRNIIDQKYISLMRDNST